VSDLLGSLLRFVLKLVLGVMALVFAVSLLLTALLVVAFTVVKALLTGKKPAPAMVFGRFRQYSPQDIWRRSPSPAADVTEIVDVEVRDITTAIAPTDADTAKPTVKKLVQGADNVSDVLPKKRIQPAD
jgi:hypothetical protein